MKHAFLILLLAMSAVMVRGASGERNADLPFRWGGSSSPNMVSNVKDLRNRSRLKRIILEELLSVVE